MAHVQNLDEVIVVACRAEPLDSLKLPVDVVLAYHLMYYLPCKQLVRREISHLGSILKRKGRTLHTMDVAPLHMSCSYAMLTSPPVCQAKPWRSLIAIVGNAPPLFDHVDRLDWLTIQKRPGSSSRQPNNDARAPCGAVIAEDTAPAERSAEEIQYIEYSADRHVSTGLSGFSAFPRLPQVAPRYFRG